MGEPFRSPRSLKLIDFLDSKASGVPASSTLVRVACLGLGAWLLVPPGAVCLLKWGLRPVVSIALQASGWLVVSTNLKILVNWDDYSQYMEKSKSCFKPPTSRSSDMSAVGVVEESGVCSLTRQNTHKWRSRSRICATIGSFLPCSTRVVPELEHV